MPDEPVLKIFIHPSGNYIASQEIERKGGTSIKVKYPAFARQNANGVGYGFEPFKFVVDEFILYTGSLLGETPMPKDMAPYYMKYVEECEEQNKNTP